MPIKVQRLGRGWEAALERRLLDDPVVNLFMIGFARLHPLDQAHWYAVTEGSEVAGVVLLVPERLVVPWCPDPDHAAAIGLFLRGRHDPCMLVGPREAGDALWTAWAGDATPERYYDQRLYALRERPEGEPVPGFRRARLEEWRTIARYSGQMEHEDLGRNPREVWPALHDRVVRERIRSGRTWVIATSKRAVRWLRVMLCSPRGVPERS